MEQEAYTEYVDHLSTAVVIVAMGKTIAVDRDSKGIVGNFAR